MCEELRSLISENENILDMKFIDKKIKSMMEYLVPESDSLEESYEIVLNYYKKNKLTKEYKMNKQIEMLIKRVDSLEKENKILRKKAEPIFYVNDNLKEPINYYDKKYDEIMFSDLNMNIINMLIKKDYLYKILELLINHKISENLEKQIIKQNETIDKLSNKINYFEINFDSSIHKLKINKKL